MSYIAIKACKFAGQSFRIGDTVPEEVIQPGAAKNLIKMQIIAPAGASSSDNKGYPIPLPPINIAIHADEGDLPLEMSNEDLQQVFDVLLSKADDAEPIIETMTNDDALILLHMVDSRKTIKAAAEARAQVLNAEPEEEPVEEPDAEEVEEPEEEPEDSAGEE